MTPFRTYLILPFFACAMQVQAKELSDSIYSNHSVNTNVNVNTKKALQVNSVMVTQKGSLRLTSQQSVTLNNNFQVQLGGTLIIQTGKPPRIKYTYDNSGNRTKREKE
jgi:hypothetical protein